VADDYEMAVIEQRCKQLSINWKNFIFTNPLHHAASNPLNSGHLDILSTDQSTLAIST